MQITYFCKFLFPRVCASYSVSNTVSFPLWDSVFVMWQWPTLPLLGDCWWNGHCSTLTGSWLLLLDISKYLTLSCFLPPCSPILPQILRLPPVHSIFMLGTFRFISLLKMESTASSLNLPYWHLSQVLIQLIFENVILSIFQSIWVSFFQAKLWGKYC